MKKYLCTLMLATVSTMAVASNVSANEYKPYVGVDYAYTNFDKSGTNLNSAILNVGTTYNEHFSTEVFYQFSDSDIRSHNEVSMVAYGLDAYGFMPVGCYTQLSLFGTAGIGHYKLKTKIPAEKRREETGLGYRLGAGVSYAIDENVSLRALARHVWTDDLDGKKFMEYNFGAQYRF